MFAMKIKLYHVTRWSNNPNEPRPPTYLSEHTKHEHTRQYYNCYNSYVS